jgi:hypothetical protein
VTSSPFLSPKKSHSITGAHKARALPPPSHIKPHLTRKLAPVRLLLFFIISGYSYAFSDKGPVYATKSYNPSSWGEGLKNRVLFTWAFVEMITWFWVFVTLREERRDIAMRIAQRKAAEEDML